MENLSPLVSQFKKYLSTSGRGLSTVNSYGTDIKSFVAYLFEQNVQFDKVELLHLSSFIEQLRDKEHGSPNSIRRKIISIRQFYKYLFESQQLPSNPFVESIIPEREEILPPLLTEKQLKKILEACAQQNSPLKKTRDLAILHLLSLEGIKVSELISLRWVDFLGSEQGDFSLRIKGEKDRTILLNKKSGKSLKDYEKILLETEQEHLTPSKLTNIFFAFKGRELSLQLEQITRHGLKFLLYEIGAKVGIKKLNTELLRHYAIHHLLETFGDLTAVQNHLGLKRAGNILKHLAKQKKEKNL